MYRPRAKFPASRKDINLERDALRAFSPAYEIIGDSACAQSPLIFASPHSGRIYPDAWLAQCRLSLRQLRGAEDAFTDDLFSSVNQVGAPLIKALFPRSFVDVNRCASELPPEWTDEHARHTLRAKAGLGVIPMAISHGEDIYRRAPRPAAGAQRLALLHRPYHSALQELIARARQSFGYAVLIDCHSMPGFGPLHVRRSDFILGDRFGGSCSRDIPDLISDSLARAGYSVTRNHPYAGGYTTAHYADPDNGIHTLQIEVNRDLYINPVTFKTKPGYDTLRSNISVMINELSEALVQRGWAAAAE